MTAKTQYRLTVNDSVKTPTDVPPSQWETPWDEMAQMAEARGINILLESRSIFPCDELTVSMFADPETDKLPEGYMKLGDKLVTSWQYEAAVTSY